VSRSFAAKLDREAFLLSPEEDETQSPKSIATPNTHIETKRENVPQKQYQSM
jgi:hypothetical protein